jgi:5-methylcytosine-specific restriction endonuclease McrA
MSGSLKQTTCGCGNVTMLKGIEGGKKKYRKRCQSCMYKGRSLRDNKCDHCGKRKYLKNLQIDHIDGDGSNNHYSNVQTLCRPCHIVKSKENGDYKRK